MAVRIAAQKVDRGRIAQLFAKMAVRVYPPAAANGTRGRLPNHRLPAKFIGEILRQRSMVLVFEFGRTKPQPLFGTQEGLG